MISVVLRCALGALVLPAAALIGATPPVSAANVLVNGSFENGPADNGGGYHRGAPAPDGWSGVGGLEIPDIIDVGYAQGGPPFLVLLTAQDGKKFVDTNGASPSGGLYQDVDGLLAGSNATLSYYVGQWAQNSAGSLVVSLIDPLSSAVLGSQTTTIAFNNGLLQSSWQLLSLSALVPNSGKLRVQFTANSGSFDRGGPGLDNMKLDATLASAAPEPANWAMMVGGFGILGVAMRRRKVPTVLA